MPDIQKPVPALVISRAPIVNPDGTARWEFLKILQGWATQIANSLNSLGQFVGIIGTTATVAGRTGSLVAALQHINDIGVVQPAGISAATDLTQGGVVLPSGASANTLGSAALESASSFDPAGAAAAAQSNAETFATAAAATAQVSAEAFASDASNLTTGKLDPARLPAAGISAVITTAALTTGGTQGSMTFTNGILTAQTPAT